MRNFTLCLKSGLGYIYLSYCVLNAFALFLSTPDLEFLFIFYFRITTESIGFFLDKIVKMEVALQNIIEKTIRIFLTANKHNILMI